MTVVAGRSSVAIEDVLNLLKLKGYSQYQAMPAPVPLPLPTRVEVGLVGIGGINGASTGGGRDFYPAYYQP